jgi:hypothetical protein
MPLPDGEYLYPSETFTWRVPRIVVDGDIVDDNTMMIFEYEVVDANGNSVSPTAPMEHSERRRGTWEARVAAPTTAGTYSIVATLSSAAGIGRIKDTFTVTALP